MSGIVERRESGTWVGRDGDGKFTDDNKPGPGLQHLHGGQGVYATPLEDDTRAPVETIGAGTPSGSTAQPIEIPAGTTVQVPVAAAKPAETTEGGEAGQ